MRDGTDKKTTKRACYTKAKLYRRREHDDDVDDNRVFPHEKFTTIKLYQYNNTAEPTGLFLPAICMGRSVGGVTARERGAR